MGMISFSRADEAPTIPPQNQAPKSSTTEASDSGSASVEDKPAETKPATTPKKKGSRTTIPGPGSS